jgi:hypothetical protein
MTDSDIFKKHSNVDIALAKMSSNALGENLNPQNIDGHSYLIAQYTGFAIAIIFFIVWGLRRYNAFSTGNYEHIGNIDTALMTLGLVALTVAIAAFKKYPEIQKYVVNSYSRTKMELNSESVIEQSQLPDPVGASYYLGFSLFIPNIQQKRIEYVPIMARRN